MKKSYSLVLAAGLTFAACEGSKQKTTWQKVTETKPDKVAAGDSGTAYANKLHGVLTAAKVEHKIITYQYRYQTRMRDEAVGTHTAVLYKNNSNPRHPWWLMDERLGKPVWLPGEDVNRQVSFYLRRTAQVVEQKQFPIGEPRAGGTMLAKNSPVVPAGEPAVTRIARAKKAPVPATATAQTAPQAGPVPFVRLAPATREDAIPFTSPTPADSRFDEIFRRAHGTDYDPASPLDRRKMETIKHALLDPREPAATRTF